MNARTAPLLRQSLVVLLLLAAFLAPAPAARSEDEATGLAGAMAAFEAADYKKAIEVAEQVPEDSPDAPKARYVVGESWLVLGDAEAAAKAFRFVLEKKPDALPAKVGLGRALTALGQDEEAKKVLEEAVAADGKDVGARRALGEFLVKTGELEKGVKLLEEAWKASKDPFTGRALVEAKIRADDLKEAKAVADKLAKTLPKHPMGPFLEALVLEKQGKDDEAIEAYEKALALDDLFLDAHKNLAILCHTRNPTYQDRERTAKAMEHYERYFALGGADERLKQTYETLKGFLHR